MVPAVLGVYSEDGSERLSGRPRLGLDLTLAWWGLLSFPALEASKANSPHGGVIPPLRAPVHTLSPGAQGTSPCPGGSGLPLSRGSVSRGPHCRLHSQDKARGRPEPGTGLRRPPPRARGALGGGKGTREPPRQQSLTSGKAHPAGLFSLNKTSEIKVPTIPSAIRTFHFCM